MVKTYIKAIVIIIILFFAVTFGIKNGNSVEISYYFGWLNARIPIWLLVYGSVIIGAIIGFLISFIYHFGLRKKLKHADKANKEMRAELELLRAKSAVPVYSENIYVSTPQPAPEAGVGGDPKHVSDAY